MFKLHIISCTFALVLCAEKIDPTNLRDLPSWITENPGFRNFTERNSRDIGNGSIVSKEKGHRGWLILLNEKPGHGIEVELEKLSLNPDLNDFLLISAWPLTAEFKKIQLFTGKFEKPLKKLRIPNTKTFYVLYSASQSTTSPEVILKYRRYGTSFEVSYPPTDNPVKEETVFEVQLKGKSPEEYSSQDFLEKLKVGVRAIARRYCLAHKIPFNETIEAQNMFTIHRISFCPFEWPERQICASVEHSVFVSGVHTSEFILDYQLTADHLRVMWAGKDFPELEELGITVFELPPTNSIVIYWSLIIGLMIIASLIGTCIFWNADYVSETSSTRSTSSEEVKTTRKPRLKLAKHQQVPSFMYTEPADGQVEKIGEVALRSTNEETPLEKKFEDVLKPGDSSQLPIRNYFGSILFSSNKAFEDDEDN